MTDHDPEAGLAQARLTSVTYQVSGMEPIAVENRDSSFRPDTVTVERTPGGVAVTVRGPLLLRRTGTPNASGTRGGVVYGAAGLPTAPQWVRALVARSGLS